jgi:hypothetical protein
MLPALILKRSIIVVAALYASVVSALPAQEELVGGEAGVLHLIIDGSKFCTFKPFVANAKWDFFFSKVVSTTGETPASDAPFPYVLGIVPPIDGNLQVAGKSGTVHATWNFSAKKEVHFATLSVVFDFDLPQVSGGSWETDAARGAFPPVFAGSNLFNGLTSSFVVTLPDKRVLKFAFAKPTSVTVQDDRQWGSARFTIRFSDDKAELAAQGSYALDMDITTAEGLAYSRELPDFMKPVKLQAGEQWIPLREELDIVPGSALDLTSLGFTDGPCGSKGRLITTSEGHFVCADEPDKPKRFYGVNLCEDSNYLTKSEADVLLDRLVCLGYNSVRIHHYESYLTKIKNGSGFDWDPEKVDQLDYLMAGCGKRGIWITTDLYVSRPIYGDAIGLSKQRLDMNRYKILIPVSEPAFQDWAMFARKFLDRVNPYTHQRVADDPALAWLSMVNEGPVTNFWGDAVRLPEWKKAWNKWLASRYPNREALAAAIPDLRVGEDPTRNTVPVPEALSALNARSRLAQVFAAETEKASYERMRDFLRDQIKCKALLTNINNSGPEVLPLLNTRSAFDYVDEHFYVDHPTFLEKAWSLPSFCENSNPIRSGASGSSAIASIRLWNKPFTVTEYNYSGPGRFRGVGGILTGAMAALQDWDGLWRFDYSYTRKVMFAPTTIGYFDMVSDPLNQAADRLAAILYLRRDLVSAPTSLAMIADRKALDNPTDKLGLTAIQSAVWSTKVGSLLLEDITKIPANYVPVPIESGNDKQAIFAALGKIEPTVPVPDNKLIRSETGQITIMPDQGVLTIDTPRSAGGYADAGKSIPCSKAGIMIDAITTDASIFVSSLDNTPIRSSKRLIVTHLTDLQNTGIRYGEAAQQTLLNWGGLPHLVRNGSAKVSITLDKPDSYTVWGLSIGGKRGEKIESQVISGQLVFTVNVKGLDGARMLYEISQNSP